GPDVSTPAAWTLGPNVTNIRARQTNTRAVRGIENFPLARLDRHCPTYHRDADRSAPIRAFLDQPRGSPKNNKCDTSPRNRRPAGKKPATPADSGWRRAPVRSTPVARERTDHTNPAGRRKTRLLRVRTWPVAAKLVGLCVGVAVVLAVGLTVLGYTQASAGL